jgi:outer membrane lipoprotein-sorting protein
LAGILGQVSGIASMKYDMVTTTPDNQSSTTTMYVKKNQARMESTQQGQQIVILINSDTKTMYMYMPAQNMALKQDFGQAPKSASDNSNSVLQNSPTVVGTETLDAKLCTVIQYTANGSTTKEWIWQAKGLPVRMQVTSSQGTTTTDFKNYDFSDIPDSTFVLPAGVTIQSLGALPTGLPGGLPAH